MVVTKEDFDRIEIGTIIYQCYYGDGRAKVGKTFVKGKSVDKNGVHIVSFVKDYADRGGGDYNKAFVNKASALAHYKKELQNIKATLLQSVEKTEKVIEKAEEKFDEWCKESEQNISNKDDNWLSGIFSDDESNEFKVNTSLIPEIKYSVGEKVFTAFNLNASNIFGRTSETYRVVEDVITKVEVYFRKKDDISVHYETRFCSNFHMRGENIFKTRAEAEQYCRDDAQKHIDAFNEKISNIDYRHLKTDEEEKEEADADFNKTFNF